MSDGVQRDKRDHAAADMREAAEVYQSLMVIDLKEMEPNGVDALVLSARINARAALVERMEAFNAAWSKK